MFGEELDDDVADALQEAIDAVADQAPGGVDDLLLLRRLLERADDDVLKALGSRARVLLRAADEATAALGSSPRPVPSADDVVRFAASEAWELGYSSRIGAIHVVLALFAFHGSASSDVFAACGVEWRALRSIVRRLGLGW
ncbi:MAG TPA: hypothetical protein VM345_16185 [Acidimicrobiales bacterium]|nr:hypothetical protein [Acidimicrobiales bacterium]